MTQGGVTHEVHRYQAVCQDWYLMLQEEGQDLVEYALVVALIGFAAVAGMGTLANDINSAFSNIGASLLTTA
jgi:pilus assembly protein Flp/PilA